MFCPDCTGTTASHLLSSEKSVILVSTYCEKLIPTKYQGPYKIKDSDEIKCLETMLHDENEEGTNGVMFSMYNYIATPINLFPPTELFSLIYLKWFSRNPSNTEALTNFLLQILFTRLKRP